MTANNIDQDTLFLNAMSVDLEEYFQVSAFENILSTDDKKHLPRRAVYATDLLLELFARKNIKATFFTLAELAQAENKLIKRITQEGHEIASHGMAHDRVYNLTAKEFLEDITRSKAILEDISGQQVTGYRAPSFSIGPKTPFAYDMLIQAGYHYSSSVHPIRHDHYGDVSAPLSIHKPIANSEFYEFPITVLDKLGHRFPVGGGGWFRVMPFFLYKQLIKMASKTRPMVFYTHPWEYDPDQPVIKNLPLKTRFRHYVNLDKTYRKLDKLADMFAWGRCDQIINKHKLYLNQ